MARKNRQAGRSAKSDVVVTQRMVTASLRAAYRHFDEYGNLDSISARWAFAEGLQAALQVLFGADQLVSIASDSTDLTPKRIAQSR